jgi:spore maturation protein A
MVMSWIFTALLAVALIFSLFLGTGSALAAAIPTGAQAGITLVISMAGSVCLWTGLGNLMEKIGITGALSRLLRPFLHRVFPQTVTDAALAASLSVNICANLLGLGNAATPMGIQSICRMKKGRDPTAATDQMCRLVVLNTASIQLIPATVAAVRTGLGCGTPFDILPAVWLTSFCSAGLGLGAAVVLGKLWPHD